MEPTIILEFLGGVIGGAFLSIIILKRSSHKRTEFRKSRTIKVFSPKKNRTASLIRGEHKRRRPRAKALKVVPSILQKELRIETPVPEVRTAPLSCPSCGLEAPESLMAEHFMGSPSHIHGPPKPQAVIASPLNHDDSARKMSGDESTDSVRHLLQMLVPPRAFGRRHRQRVINPLSNLVKPMGPRGDQ